MDKEVETFGWMTLTAAVRICLFSIVPLMVLENTIVTMVKMQVLFVHDAAAADNNDDDDDDDDDLLLKYIYREFDDY